MKQGNNWIMIAALIVFMSPVLAVAQDQASPQARAQSSGQAATESATQREDDDVISVPVQQSEIKIQPLEVKSLSIPVDYELSISNWLPNNLSLPAGMSDVGGFSQTNVPELSLNRYSEIRPLAQGRLELVAGLSYAQLARSGSLPVGTTNVAETENLNITTLRAGVAYRYFGWLHGALQPLVRVALLPTWVTAPSNAIDQNGLSSVGVPVEAAFEMIWSPSWWPSAQAGQAGGLALGAHTTYGSAGSADLSGVGADAILRMTF